MHLLLTDRLTCPRCGPEFGLILLADRMEDRRVIQGTFGCPNCRDAYPVVEGFGDLRAPPRTSDPQGFAGGPDARVDDAAEAARLTALLGVTQGPGTLVFSGIAARHARALAEAVEGVHVLAVDPDLRRWGDAPGVSRTMAGPGLPVFGRALRGVAVDGRLGPDALREAARAVAPGGRVVVIQAMPDAPEVLAGAGLQVLASESGTVVARRG